MSELASVNQVVWDGVELSLPGGGWQVSGRRLERLRRCDRGAACEAKAISERWWRFGERIELNEALPTDFCPDHALTATYRYDECPFQAGSSEGEVEFFPCLEVDTSCSYQATLTLTPQPGVTPDSVPPPASLEDDCEGPPHCLSVLPVGEPPLAAARAPGEPCLLSAECAMQHYCSRRLEAGGCAPLGAETCQPAPERSQCPDLTEPLCFCEGPPEELPGDNPCLAQSEGYDAFACP